MLAIISGASVTWDDAKPMLLELAGRQAIEEIALDRELARELAATGVTIGPEETRREQNLLRQTMGSTDADAAVKQLRAERGLGPTRYAALLWRSAALRTLSRADAMVSEEERLRERELRFGPAWRARLLVVATMDAAQVCREAISAAEPSQRVETFARLARERSLDAKASEGGLVVRMSALDQTIPLAVRQTLPNAAAGTLSPIIAIERGYALVLPESQITARTPSEDERRRVDAALDLGKQRLAMDRLATRLLARAQITVLDPSAAWRESR